MAYSSRDRVWGVRLTGWIRAASASLSYSTVAVLHGGPIGRKGYVSGWTATENTGGGCEVRDLGNVSLPISGLYQGVKDDNASQSLNGSAAQVEELPVGQQRSFQVIYVCQDAPNPQIAITPSARFYVVENGFWTRRDFAFGVVRVLGSSAR